MKVFLAYFLDAAPNTFSPGKDKSAEKKESEFDRVSQKVGQSQIQIDSLNKTQSIWEDCLREGQMYRRQG